MAGETTCPNGCGRPQGTSDRAVPGACWATWSHNPRLTQDCLRIALARVTADLAAERARREQAEADYQRLREGLRWWFNDGAQRAVLDRAAALAPRASGEGQP